MNRYTIPPPTPMRPVQYFEWLNTLPFVWPTDGPRVFNVVPSEFFVETTATIDGYPVVTTSAAERPDKWIITRYALRKRFTLTERAEIELASADNPSGTAAARLRAAKLRMFMNDLMSANRVNLKAPEITTGLAQMETFGLLNVGRAAEISDTEPTEEERTGA